MTKIIKNDMELELQDITAFISDFCTAVGFESGTAATHIQFKAICQAVGNHFFNDNTALLYIANNKVNGIDILRLYKAYNYYLAICNLYNKVPNIVSFCYFMNLQQKYLYDNSYEIIENNYNYYNNSNNIDKVKDSIDIINNNKIIMGESLNRNGLTNIYADIIKGLSKNRENSLKDVAIDRGGAVGIAIVGNTEYSWDKPGQRAVQGEQIRNNASLPCFGGKSQGLPG